MVLEIRVHLAILEYPEEQVSLEVQVQQVVLVQLAFQASLAQLEFLVPPDRRDNLDRAAVQELMDYLGHVVYQV